MPEGWVVLCRESWGLSRDLSWAWWRALTQSKWSTHVAFREAILRYARCAYPAQSASRAQVSAWLEPGTLLQITAELVTQYLLLRRDAGLIDQAVLDRLDARGAWKEQRSTA